MTTTTRAPLTPRIAATQFAGIGRRWTIQCPVHGWLAGRHHERADAEGAWEQHVEVAHVAAGGAG